MFRHALFLVYFFPGSVANIVFFFSSLYKFRFPKIINTNLIFIILLLFTCTFSAFFNAQYVSSYLPVANAYCYLLLYLIVLCRGIIITKSILKTFFLANFALYIFASVGQYELFFADSVDGMRFRSYMLEPSVLGILSAWFIVPFLQFQKRSDILFVLIGISLVVSTFSGSGVVLLVLVSLLYYRPGSSYVRSILLVLMATSVGVFYFDEITDLVFSRAEDIYRGNISNSVFLRFVAPFRAVKDLINEDFFVFFFGTGPRINRGLSQ